MRIGVQSQLLVMSCFVVSLISFSLIGWQFSNSFSAQSRVAEIKLERSEIIHLQSMLSQWMTTIDLFFNNRQSYLASGVKRQGFQLKDKLKQLTLLSQDAKTSFEQLNSHILLTLDKVNQAAIHGPEDSKRWSTYLEDIDLTAGEIIEHYQILEDRSLQLLKSIEAQSAWQQRRLKFIFALALILTVGVLILIGVWNSRNIVGPVKKLLQLSDNPKLSSDRQLLKQNFAHSPREMQVLAFHLATSLSQLSIGKHKAELANIKIEQQNHELQSTIASLEATRKQLVQSEKLASLGQLAAGVAHEINNPVAFILSNMDTLRGYVVELETFIKHINEDKCTLEQLRDLYQEDDLGYVLEDIPLLIDNTKQGLNRVKNIVSDLKVFSNVKEESLQQLDLNLAIEQALALTGDSLHKGIQLSKELTSIPVVHAGTEQLVQVCVNLLKNAAEAIIDSGKIIIRTRFVESDRQVMISIADTGKGIEEEKLNQIFDPFFTTKAVGEGTGLGLHFCHSIVANLGGEISVESELNKGSTFTLSFPIDSPSAYG